MLASLRPHLLRCGYRADLLFSGGYKFSDTQAVDLAAFAHEPLDARSACVAAIRPTSPDPKVDVLGRRAFGAPVVFACLDKIVQVWRPGPQDAELVERGLTALQLTRFFAENEKLLAPNRIYTAKTIGRLSKSRQVRNAFVDTELLPYAERQFGRQLVVAVEGVVDELQRACELPADADKLSDDQQVWVLRSTFRLLAARVLRDKGVPRFKTIKLEDLAEVFEKVRDHYGSRDDQAIDLGTPRQRDALLQAASVFGGLGNLRHLTTESLADVYERALVDKDTRKISGTHRTPSYIADYMLWQLAPWISKQDPNELRVFEAACGHAPFLVASMRLLRTMDLGMDPDRLSRFFRERLSGIDYDPFAVEVARLSLTLADVPRKNGWNEVRHENMFAPHNALAREAAACRVLLSNPPFEGAKPIRVMDVALRRLQAGAVFGLVVPTSQLFTRDPRKGTVNHLREWMLKHCQFSEVTLLPDGVFQHADQEVALVLGRRTAGSRPPVGHVRCRRVREDDLQAFQDHYAFSTDRVFPQRRFASRPDHLPWVEELDEDVWSLCRKLRPLHAIANLGKGLEYRARNLPAGVKTFSEQRFKNAIPGYVALERELNIDRLPPEVWMNLSDDAVRRPGTGTEVGTPQVLVNYAPVSRGVWRLKALLDEKGRPVTSQFLTVRPRFPETKLLYLWALCNSPAANAYVYTHSLKRHVLASVMREVPVPKADPTGERRVVEAAAAYFSACRRSESASLFNADAQFEIPVGELHRLLRVVDAEVLRLYDLPSRSERKLLAMFDAKRPGVPGEFRGYYPRGFTAAVPLYVFVSRTYQKFRRDGNIELPPGMAERFDELVAKHEETGLTPDELAELERVQAEVAGRDYALRTPDTTWADAIERSEEATRESLARIANRLADLAERGERRG